ncbi:cupin domain-containing protein [Phytoactinopolyspora mesophila]|nr:hypothetical protein [Phytoactinopolyspora mesophila]
MALPLADYELIRATDFDEAKDALFRSWRPHHLERVGASTAVDFQLNGVPLGEMSVSAMTFGAEVVSDIAPFGIFAILVSVSGECVIRSDSQQATVKRGRAAVLSATDRIRTHWSSDCAVLIFTLDAGGIERHLSEILDEKLTDPLRFELEMDIRAGRGRDLYRRGLRQLLDRLEQHDAMLDDLSVAARFEAFIMRALMMAQPNNYSARLASLMSE